MIAQSIFGAGDLNRRLVLEQPVETPDGEGGVTRSYQTVASVWASVTPLSAKSDASADNPGAVIAYRIVIRAGRDVTTRHRFREGDTIFRIASVREYAGKRFLDIHAEQKTD